jgi:hypothetical protein
LVRHFRSSQRVPAVEIVGLAVIGWPTRHHDLDLSQFSLRFKDRFGSKGDKIGSCLTTSDNLDASSCLSSRPQHPDSVNRVDPYTTKSIF